MFLISLAVFGFMSVITFIVFGIDKLKAKKGKRRIKEKTLIWLCVFGGALGGFIGMYFFRHKTLKPKFFISVPIILLLQTGLVFYLYYLCLRGGAFWTL